MSFGLRADVSLFVVCLIVVLMGLFWVVLARCLLVWCELLVTDVDADLVCVFKRGCVCINCVGFGLVEWFAGVADLLRFGCSV